MSGELLEQFRDWLAAHRAELLADIRDWVTIPSVSRADQASEGKPFGPEVDRMFRRVQVRATELGFATEWHDGYALSVIHEGETPAEIGLVSHLDVVPAGPGWTREPFASSVEGDFVIGRGARDNKGPAVGDLYLLRFLRDAGVRLRHGIRVIYGGGEETGMNDMHYYVQHAPIPAFSVITDGRFPVNFAQKGSIRAIAEVPAGPLMRAFRGGHARNAIPAESTIVLPPAAREHALAALAAYQGHDITAETTDAGVTLTAHGAGGHGSSPEHAPSAVATLTAFLDEAALLDDPGDVQAVRFLSFLTGDPFGGQLGIAEPGGEFGPLTLNVGLVEPAGEGLSLQLDLRYPAVADSGRIRSQLDAALAAVGGRIVTAEHVEASAIDQESSVVRRLQAIYAEATGDDAPPYTMGGFTHSRVLPRSLTFGPTLRDGLLPVPDFLPEGHGSAHGPDEVLHLPSLVTALEIYVVALQALDEETPLG